MCYSQDSLGLIARTVADAALVLEVVAGHDPLDPSSFDVAVPSYSTRLGRRGRRVCAGSASGSIAPTLPRSAGRRGPGRDARPRWR